MSDFSQKRFVDIGEKVYLNLLQNINFEFLVSCAQKEEEAGVSTDTYLREVFTVCADAAFIAAEEFAHKFRHQENESERTS